MAVREALLEFGFSPDKIDMALSICGENLEHATEWIISHSEDPPVGSSEGTWCKGEGIESRTTKDTGESANNHGSSEENEAKSIKCNDCGKLFKSPQEVEFHAVKSGHASFSESTEEKILLTDQERRSKLKELEDKLSQRRKEREEQERNEKLERERKRIQMGKDMTETKRKIKDQELLQLAEERKREKMEDKLARQRVKEQIERDRHDRMETALASANTSKNPSHSSTHHLTEPSKSQGVTKSYDVTRLQMRLPCGSPVVQEFNVKEPLSAVRLWILLNSGENSSWGLSQSFNMSTTYPRKVFDDEDMDKPLISLGLAPSAVLVVTNKRD